MKINIEIEWWENEGQDEINEGHKLELREVAMREVDHKMRDTYIAGELHHMIDGIPYDGHWELTEK